MSFPLAFFCFLVSCICFQALRTPKSCKRQSPPFVTPSSQLLQLRAGFHQLLLGPLDLRYKCFHSKLCQLGRKTDGGKSKCNHAYSGKCIGFFLSLFKATSFYCKTCKSTLPKAFRSSSHFWEQNSEGM